MRKARVGFLATNGLAQAGQIFLERFRRMYELAVGRPSQNRDLAAQCFEQFGTGDRSGAMVYIEHHLEPPGSDRFDIDELAHGVEMSLAGVRPLLRGSQTFPVGQFQTVDFEQLKQPSPHLVVEDGAVGRKRFEPVPLDRIMAGGDFDAAGRPPVPHQEAARRRGGDPHVEHPATDRFEACLHGPLEHHAGRAAVAGHDHRTAPAENAEGLRELHDEVRIQSVSDDAAQAADAKNSLGHDRSLVVAGGGGLPVRADPSGLDRKG